MLIGIFLGISISVSLASLIIIFTTTTGLIAENPATGAAIGTTTTVSYALITLVLSLVTTLFLISILRKYKKS
jgi:hypothetical protein